MNQTQENKKHMMDAVQAYLNEHAATWQSIPKLGEIKNRYDELLAAIAQAATEQAAAHSTLGQSKLTLKKSIAVTADILNDLIEVMATINGDDELARRMSDAYSTIFRLSYDEFMLRVQYIIERAVENQETLTNEYGMTSEQLSGLQAEMDEFLELMGKPREYQIRKGVATKAIDQLVDDAMNLLNNEMDKIMKLFSRRSPSFYQGYVQARVIVDL